MWYLVWILGVCVACSFGIINAIRLAHKEQSWSDTND
jgi:cyd operon protein YbgT